MQPQDERVIKKPYQSPQLHVYGDIRELTQTTGTTAPKRDAPAPATTRPG